MRLLVAALTVVVLAFTAGTAVAQVVSSGTLIVGDGNAAPGGSGSVDVTADVDGEGLGAWTIDIVYDPAVVTAVGCTAHPAGLCNPDYDPDDTGAGDTVRLPGASANGLDGETVLATIEFECGDGEGTTDLTVVVNVFADATAGAPQPVDPLDVSDGSFTCSGDVVPNGDDDEPPVDDGDDDGVPIVPIILAIVGVTAVAGAVAATAAVRSARRSAERKRRQEDAREDEPPNECQPGARYCGKKKLEVKAAPMAVAQLTISAHDPDSGEKSREMTVRGSIVDDLNRAVSARRQARKREDSERLLMPVARELADELAACVRPEPGARDVSVVGRLAGGKVTFQFTLYRCESTGTGAAWKEEDKWKETLEDERDEPVATLRALDGSDAGMPGRIAPELTRSLLEFIEKV